MSEQKYSLRLAAVDAFSSTFGSFSKQSGKLQDAVKLQRAELESLNKAARAASGFERMTEKTAKTTEALAASRVELAKLKREHETAAATVGRLAAEHEKASAAVRQLEDSTEATVGQVRAARQEQRRLAGELGTATTKLERLDKAQDRATAGTRTLESTQRAERNELQRLQAALTEAGVDTTKLASEQRRLEAATESANSALKSQRASLESVSKAQGRIDANRAARADLRGQMVETAAVAYLASRPIDQAMNLETAMADVGKVINFEGGQREAMASANLQLASDRLIASSGMTAVDLARIEYAAGQSGIGNNAKDSAGKQREIMEFTRDAAIMGSAFDMSAEDAGSTMAGWRASMQLDRAGTLDLADATNYLGNNFNASASDIASVVKRYGAVGKASGLTPEQSAALSAAFLNPGTEKEIAGTGFKNFTAALTKGKAATKGQRETWEELGFDPEDLAADMQRNAPKTIMTVLKRLQEAPEEQQAALATQLFGSESIGAIQPLLQNLGEVERAFQMVGDKSKYATSVIGDQGSMMQEAAGVANTSRTSLNAFTAKLTRLSTVVGNAMLPTLERIMTPLGAMVDGLSWAAETFPGVTSAIAIAAGGLVALKVGALGLKFAGLLLGQTFNRAGLARARLDSSTARTALEASLAVNRLNGSLSALGSGGAGGGSGSGGKRGGRSPGGRAGGRRPGRLARLGRFAQGAAGRVAGFGGRVLGGGAGRVLGTVAAIAAPSLLESATARAAPLAEAVGARAAPALEAVGARAAPMLETVAAKAVPMATAAASVGGGTARALGKLAGRAATPLMVLSYGAEAAEGLANNDARQVGAAGGGLAGGLAGAAAGASIGATIGGTIGTVVPIVGNAVGAAVGGVVGGIAGGIGGSGAGEWLGEKLGALVDELSSSEKIAESVATTNEDNRQIHFAPSITMQASGDPAADRRLADQVISRLKGEFVPLMMANPLAVRRGAALTDGGS